MAFIYAMVDTWNDNATNFNAIKMDITNTTSGAGSRLIDITVNGASIFNVDKSANIFCNNIGVANISFANWWTATQSSNGGIGFGSGHVLVWASGGNTLGNGSYSFSSLIGLGDIGLSRNGVNVLEVNDSNPGTFAHIVMFTNRTVGVTFASLPTPASVSVGGRAMITNSNTAVFNATAAGGGANVVPVFSDGAQWRVG